MTNLEWVNIVKPKRGRKPNVNKEVASLTIN